MENVKRYSSFIKRIITAKEPIRKRLIKSSNLNIIKAICELLFNILQKNIVVNKSVLTHLKKHKTVLHKLLLESAGFESRRNILVKNSKIILPLLSVFK
jgi:hypothetical protein